MALSTAWILDFGHGLTAAVGVKELQHLVDGPKLENNTLLPSHCNNTFDWQGESLLVLNLSDWMGIEQEFPSALQRPLVCVLAYQDQPGQKPNFGAISLATIPSRLQVNDTQACALPESLSSWKNLAISCFMHDEQAIPILDLPVLFNMLTDTGEGDVNIDQHYSGGVSGF